MISNVHKVAVVHFFNGLKAAKMLWSLSSAAYLLDYKISIAKALNKNPNADVKQQELL